MSNLVIVAIPSEDDYVHKISSEKVPHMTLLFLGDAMSNPNVTKIVDFVEHATDVWEQGPFMMDVDHRGKLGEDEADVLFFRDKGWMHNQVEQFRWWLLQYDPIRKAYDSAEQREGDWIPHLTLGYPDTPAKEDTRDYPGIGWVNFDRIAVWFGDYEGPEFRLEYPEYDLAEVSMSTAAERGEEFISHYGVLGMRWGVRKARGVSTTVQTDTGLVKRQTKMKAEGGEAHPASNDAIKAAIQKQKLKKSGAAALSNQELQELARRLQLEAQVGVLTSSKGKQFVKGELESQGKQGLRRAPGAALKSKRVRKGAATLATTAALAI